MKSAGAIRHKLNQVRFRHLKKRIETELRQVPGRCLFNVSVPPPGISSGQDFDGHPVVSLVPVSGPNPVGLGICLYGAGDPASWKPSFCDDRVDGGERARKCDLFCPRKSKEQVKADFRRELEEMTLPEVAYHYPDMAALIWVLDEADIPVADDDTEEPLPENGFRGVPEIETAPAPPPREAQPLESPEPSQLPTSVPDLDDFPRRPWWVRLLRVLGYF